MKLKVTHFKQKCDSAPENTELRHMLILFILCWVGIGYLGGKIAAKKGYSPKLGVILGFIFGWMWLLVALFLPRTTEAIEQDNFENELAAAPKIANCPSCGKRIPFGSTVCPECEYQIGKR